MPTYRKNIMQDAPQPYTLALMNDPFLLYLIQQFQVYCLERMLVPNITNLLSFLMVSRFFAEEVKKQFVILNDYKTWAKTDHYPNKTQVIKAIAVRYEIDEQEVWDVLQKPFYPFENSQHKH